MIFDISLPAESDGTVQYHPPTALAKSIKPASITLPGLREDEIHFCELCILFWSLGIVFFQNQKPHYLYTNCLNMTTHSYSIMRHTRQSLRKLIVQTKDKELS